MTELLSGKHVVITGGSMGIGLVVIQKCLQYGAAKVAVFDIRDNDDAIANLQKEYPDREVIHIKTDVSCKENVEQSFVQAKAKFAYLDIVIGNAGVADERFPEKTIQVNLIGVMNSTYAAIESLSIAQGGRGGVILNVASMGGLNYLCGHPAYTASKYGVVGFTQSFGHKYYSNTYGIRFLTVCPGLTLTNMFHNTVSFDFDKEANTRYISTKRFQSVDQGADAIIHVLQHGKHGSLWIAEGGEVEQVTVQQFWKDA